MIKYTKIDTLFARDQETFKVVPDILRKVEFTLFDLWDVSEKINGTNIRICFDYPSPEHLSLGAPRLRFGGRSNNAQIPAFLLDYLQEIFTIEKMLAAFDEDSTVTLFGEGYGAKIQKGGGNYRPNGVAVRLFDVNIAPRAIIGQSTRGIWLRQEDVLDVASKLGVGVATNYGSMHVKEIINMARDGELSSVAIEDGGTPGHLQEGVVARAPFGVLDRLGRRIMWKLKTKDF